MRPKKQQNHIKNSLVRTGATTSVHQQAGQEVEDGEQDDQTKEDFVNPPAPEQNRDPLPAGHAHWSATPHQMKHKKSGVVRNTETIHEMWFQRRGIIRDFGKIGFRPPGTPDPSLAIPVQT